PFTSTPPTPTATHTLSLHDALPISRGWSHSRHSPARPQQVGQAVADQRQAQAHDDHGQARDGGQLPVGGQEVLAVVDHRSEIGGDRKSTRLNSSHRTISYAVFCLKK